MPRKRSDWLSLLHQRRNLGRSPSGHILIAALNARPHGISNRRLASGYILPASVVIAAKVLTHEAMALRQYQRPGYRRGPGLCRGPGDLPPGGNPVKREVRAEPFSRRLINVDRTRAAPFEQTLMTRSGHCGARVDCAAKTLMLLLRPQASLKEGNHICDRSGANRSVKPHRITGRCGEAGAKSARLEWLQLAVNQ